MNDVLESAATLGQTPGQILKAAREDRQISVGEIAQRLLLSKSTIAAIEEDDYSRIVALVYAEGYLKAYAQFLQIPVNTVLASFRRLNVYSKSVATVETKTQVQNKVCGCRCLELSNLLKGQCRGYVILGAAIILILAVLAFFVSKQFVGKNAEVIHVPNNVTNVIDKNDTTKDKIISDNQMPIITTTDAEKTVKPTPVLEVVSKKKHDSKKMNLNEQDVSLMLDTKSTPSQSSSNDEPNLILTKTKDALEQ